MMFTVVHDRLATEMTTVVSTVAVLPFKKMEILLTFLDSLFPKL